MPWLIDCTVFDNVTLYETINDESLDYVLYHHLNLRRIDTRHCSVYDHNLVSAARFMSSLIAINDSVEHFGVNFCFDLDPIDI